MLFSSAGFYLSLECLTLSCFLSLSILSFVHSVCESQSKSLILYPADRPAYQTPSTSTHPTTIPDYQIQIPYTNTAESQGPHHHGFQSGQEPQATGIGLSVLRERLSHSYVLKLLRPPPSSLVSHLPHRRLANPIPTAFHAVQSSKELLAKAGFQEIKVCFVPLCPLPLVMNAKRNKEKDSWSSTCRPGGKYYLTRNSSTLVAFAVGKKWQPGNSISMVGAHTDSPVLRVKPVSSKRGEGYVQVGVETYGGGIWHTCLWFPVFFGVGLC